MLALAGIAPIAAAAPATSGATGTVTITVTELRNAKGVVRACMTTRQNIFPKCIKDPTSHRTVVPAGKTVTIHFDKVKPGEYAIALLHDENNNGKADRVLGMAPKEGYGFSRDAPVNMAPPDWKDAVFTVNGAANKVAIRMRYFL